MKKILLVACCLICNHSFAQDPFPNGEVISQWFNDSKPIDRESLGKTYLVTNFGVKDDSTTIQTEQLQAVIDLAHEEGGGVLVIPKGVFLSGALFFKQNTHLHIQEGGVIKGSDNIIDFPLIDTRIEGVCMMYFAALINADGVDGFTITGEGTINGNGLRYWQHFWLRRKFNPTCTNTDEMRPRLVYISNSKNVELSGVRLENSPFWTTHIYNSKYIKLIGLTIFSPQQPVKAPSTDAIDIDVCNHMLIKDCVLSANDDGIALKGGKGIDADKKPENGANFNIIIEDCYFNYCRSALTCGSESIHNYNVILRNCKISNSGRLLRLKMRPDTPQKYEHILVENIEGDVISFLFIKPWTQFLKLEDSKEMPMSYGTSITMQNLTIRCKKFFDVVSSPQFELSNFTLKNINITAKDKINIPPGVIDRLTVSNLIINGKIINSSE